MGDYNDLKNILNYNGFIFRLNGSDYMYLNHKINLFKGKSDALLNNVIVDEDYQRKELISYLIWVAIIIKWIVQKGHHIPQLIESFQKFHFTPEKI